MFLAWTLEEGGTVVADDAGRVAALYPDLLAALADQLVCSAGAQNRSRIHAVHHRLYRRETHICQGCGKRTRHADGGTITNSRLDAACCGCVNELKVVKPRSVSWVAEQVLPKVNALMKKRHPHLNFGPSEMSTVEMDTVSSADVIPTDAVVAISYDQIRSNGYDRSRQCAGKESCIERVEHLVQPFSDWLKHPVVGLGLMIPDNVCNGLCLLFVFFHSISPPRTHLDCGFASVPKRIHGEHALLPTAGSENLQ